MTNESPTMTKDDSLVAAINGIHKQECLSGD